jgi:hypothetical protein
LGLVKLLEIPNQPPLLRLLEVLSLLQPLRFLRWLHLNLHDAVDEELELNLLALKMISAFL